MSGWDSTLFLWLNLGPDAAPWLVAAARWASGQLPPAMVTAALALALALAGRPDWRATAARALAAMALAALAASLAKRGFAVTRPFALGLGTQWLAHGASAGFPSAHASAALACSICAVSSPVSTSLRPSSSKVAWRTDSA